MGNSEGTPPSDGSAAVPVSLEPLHVTGVTTATIGTAIWAVLLVACLLGRSWLEAAGHASWTQVCAAGFALGLIGMTYTRRRARRLAD